MLREISTDGKGDEVTSSLSASLSSSGQWKLTCFLLCSENIFVSDLVFATVVCVVADFNTLVV